ncbi:hypothetical protein BYT27DRAFT_7181295 [Phlegmacium glaucopus]|nr:hypothetical protein BYT27DRAFT_7181295 [Phlegmacium glaucopus]
MLPDQVTSNWNAINARNYSSLAALVFTLADYIMTIRSEYVHIWMWRAPLWSPRGLYFLTRYLAIITQIVHYSLVQKYLNRGPVQPHQCRTWFIFLATSAIILVAAFDTVLLLRVYALYNKSARIYMLVVPLILQYGGASLLVGRRAFPLDSFTSCCDLYDTPRVWVGILGGLTVAAHVPLWVATFWRRSEASDLAVARLVVHEGSLSFGFITIHTAVTLSYSVVTRSGNPFAIFVWPIVAVSVASCRMIINMRSLKAASLRQENRPWSSPSIAFTSYINTYFTIEEIQMVPPREEDQDGPVGGSS